MSARNRRLLWAIVAAGLVVRLVLSFATFGDGPDVRAFQRVADALADDPLHVYGTVNASEPHQWPYPPAYFPWIAASRALHETVGLPFHGWIQVAPILADAAIALVVQDFLGRRGARDSTRLAAAAAVALGPSFGIISGYQSQFDAVAILPALLGLIAWERLSAERRAVAAGALVGLGGALKVTPLLVLLAILPAARSPREGATLLAAAGAVLLAVAAPYLVSEPEAVADSLGYAGLAGVGGITLVLQPRLAENWLSPPASVDPSQLVGWLSGHGTVANGALIAAIAAFLLVCRPPPLRGAVFLWLAGYVFATGFFFQYAVWGLPFFLLAGHVRRAVALQAALLGPALIFYMRPWDDSDIALPYAAVMVAVWAALVAALAVCARRIWAERPRPAAAIA